MSMAIEHSMDAAEIEGMHGMHGLHSMAGADGMNVFVMDGDGEAGEKRIKIVMEDHMGEMSGQAPRANNDQTYGPKC